ncbi:hypothetical protein L6452_13820 [Arctium lappa]|uniref:Uncharacterized protein n=1 Tax=Arctium lappa TaxID=4217 RepID=A0ACB9CJP2_ARCLA|nr:hypothetical protein L6452_13820 [Arctium lappa]
MKNPHRESEEKTTEADLLTVVDWWGGGMDGGPVTSVDSDDDVGGAGRRQWRLKFHLMEFAWRIQNEGRRLEGSDRPTTGMEFGNLVRK